MESKGLLAPQYQNEDAAREHIEKIRWPEGPVCPHCGSIDKASRVNPRPGSKKPVRKGVWWCQECQKQFTVTVGSIFEDSHIPLHKWLLAIHLMLSSKKGISAHQLMRNLEIGSYRSAWFMAHRIRWALTQEPVKTIFSGGIVEMDETYIGGKFHIGPQVDKKGERPKDRPAPTANKTPVVSVLQRGGSVRSYPVKRVTANNLKPILGEMVSKNVHLMTDTSTVLTNIGGEYKHSQVNHLAKEYSRMENGELISTNTVEGYFSILKRGNIGVYHHWSKKYMPHYLREFDWRYNQRKTPDMERTVIALQMVGGKRLFLKSPEVGIESIS